MSYDPNYPIYLTDDSQLAKLNMYLMQDIPDVCVEVASALKDLKAKIALFGLDFDMFDTSTEDDEYFAQLSQYGGFKRNSETGQLVQVDKIAENFRDSLFLRFAWEPNENGTFNIEAEVIRGAELQAMIDADELDSVTEGLVSESTVLSEGGSYYTAGAIKDMKVVGIHTWSGELDVADFEGKKISAILKKYPKAYVQIETDKGNNEVVINLGDANESFISFDLKKPLVKGVDYKTSNAMREPTSILKEEDDIELDEAISKEVRAGEAEVSRKVKDFFKAQNLDVRVRLVPSQRENTWIQVWRKDDKTVIPNELRKKGVELVYGSTKSVRDVNDIDFGNFNARGMAMQVKQWMELIGITKESLEDTGAYFDGDLNDMIEAKLAMKPGKGKEEVETGKQAGFDLTDISPSRFVRLLSMFDIDKDFVIRRKNNEFQWKGNDILIVTANNPITGEYYNKDLNRGNEIGYASYIGLEGSQENVKKAYNYISKYGEWKDRSPTSRDYI